MSEKLVTDDGKEIESSSAEELDKLWEGMEQSKSGETTEGGDPPSEQPKNEDKPTDTTPQKTEEKITPEPTDGGGAEGGDGQKSEEEGSGDTNVPGSEEQPKPSEGEGESTEDGGIGSLGDLSEKLKDADPITPSPDSDSEDSSLDKTAEEISAEENFNPEEHINFNEYLNNPTNPEKTKKSIKRLLGKVQSLKKEIADRSGEIQKLKENPPTQGEAVPDGVNVEELQNELNVYRRRYNVEADDTIQQEFDQRLKFNNQTIENILKEHGMPEEGKEFEDGGKSFSLSDLRASGGIVGLANSSDPAKNQIYDQIMESLPSAKADIIRVKVADSELVRQSRESKIKELSEDSQKYFDEIESKHEEALKDQEEQLKNAQQQKIDFMNDVRSQYKFFQEASIPDNVAEDQRAMLTASNENAKKLNTMLDQALSPQTTEDFAQVALNSVLAVHLYDQNQALLSEVKRIQEENDRIKKAGMVTSSHATPPASTATPAPKKQLKPADSFDAAMDQIAKQKISA